MRYKRTQNKKYMFLYMYLFSGIAFFTIITRLPTFFFGSISGARLVFWTLTVLAFIMFYKITLQKVIHVSPKDLGRTLHRQLLIYLRRAVEGQPLPSPDSVASIAAEHKTANKSSAVVIAVLDILHAEALQGKVLDDGSVSFILTYDALVLKLHRGEVLDVVVKRVGREGWWGDVFAVGDIFISQSQMSMDPANMEWVYESDSVDGFWVSKDAMRSVKVDEVVRVRVIAETPQSEGSIAIGTMIGPYLGPL